MKKITLLLFFIVLKLNAQSVSNYVFSQSTEIYTSTVGVNSTANGDDGSQNLIPIGFDFIFGGQTYSTFSISTNGFIRLGDIIPNLSFTNAFSSSVPQRPLIAPFWDDHNRNTGSIQYNVSGIAPNRILEIGWDSINLGNNGGASATAFGSFKMRLFESNGQIEFIYGSTMTPAGALTASIGLNDATTFLSITPNIGLATSSNSIANNNINSTQNIIGLKYTFNQPLPCSGIPDPGNTIADVTTVCSNTNFNLSLQNQTIGSDVAYQWQKSPDGIDYTDITGSTSSSYSAFQTVTTFYQCRVTCSSASITSAPIEIVMNDPVNCFCSPLYTNGKTLGDLISNVVITGTSLANNTGNEPLNPYYTYFTGLPNYTATLQAGDSYDMNITVGTFGMQSVAVWIDYNDDTIFSTSERVGYTSGTIDANGTGVFPITLDCNAIAGIHRMRIRDVFNTAGSIIDPCSSYQYGETEDYDVTILEAIGCQALTGLGVDLIDPISASLFWTTQCTQIGWDVHVTAPGGGLPLDAPSNTNSSSPLLLSSLEPATSYEFYVRSICINNELSSWTGPFLFTTEALPIPIENDNCEIALPLTNGTTFEEHYLVGTNVDATNTLGQPNPTCAVFNFGGDVWYSAIVPPDGKITIEVQRDPGSPFIDSGLTVFRGTCSSLTALGCSDDEGIGSFSKLNLTGLIPGETIFARVWEYGNNVYGTFRIAAWSPTLSSNSFEISNFKYYPIPVKDFLHLSYSTTIHKVIVYTLLGQEVISLVEDSKECKIDLSSYSSGIYMVKVFSNESQNTIKITKE